MIPFTWLESFYLYICTFEYTGSVFFQVIDCKLLMVLFNQEMLCGKFVPFIECTFEATGSVLFQVVDCLLLMVFFNQVMLLKEFVSFLEFTFEATGSVFWFQIIDSVKVLLLLEFVPSLDAPLKLLGLWFFQVLDCLLLIVLFN